MYTSLQVWWEYGGGGGIKKSPREPALQSPALHQCSRSVCVWFHFGSLMSVFMGGWSMSCGSTPPLSLFEGWLTVFTAQRNNVFCYAVSVSNTTDGSLGPHQSSTCRNPRVPLGSRLGMSEVALREIPAGHRAAAGNTGDSLFPPPLASPFPATIHDFTNQMFLILFILHF